MNSRQRRKLAAARHNMLRIEEEAYREDRVRDPDKYTVRVKRIAEQAEEIAALKADLEAWKTAQRATIDRQAEEILTLETSLAERWENLNVQDGVIDGLKEEIAALKSRLAGLTTDLDRQLAQAIGVVRERETEIATLKKERAVDAILKNSADKLTGDLWEKIAELESYANDQDENIGAMIKTEATLQAENANLTSELARSREALLREWREKGSFSHGLTVAAEIAREKYNREIAQQGEEG